MNFIAPKGILRLLKRLWHGIGGLSWDPAKELSDRQLRDIGLLDGHGAHRETRDDRGGWSTVGGPPRFL